MSWNPFHREVRELIAEGLASGRLDRREVLGGLGVAALALAAGGSTAEAAAKEIVLANYGGDAATAMKVSFGEPFTKDTGIPVVIDGSGPTLGKIRAMVQSGNVTWDICDSSPGDSFILGRAGELEKIDYSIVDRSKMLPGFDMPYCAGISAYSFVLAFDRKAVGDTPPKNWVDFWDVKKYPGKRGLWHDMTGVLEAALMADGVPRDKLYPIDVERAFKKIKEIKPHTIFWSSGSNSQQLLRDGEVTMAQIWSTRARILSDGSKDRLSWTWNDGLLLAGVFSVPKNNPAGKEAMTFINSVLIPERQISFLRTLGSGPSNPAAAKMVPPELERVNPTSDAARAVQGTVDDTWYADNYEKVFERYLELIGS
ncbi:MAG TPA: ABC transporter substrate-binding protein [Xanthobacteraceae bacterium]|nr:ABC transporter substrate-binding protein [Xanthobacteraceae bacterium]